MLTGQQLCRSRAALRNQRGLTALCLCLASLPAAAQSFRVQCPSSTTLHSSDTSSAYLGPVNRTATITRADGTHTPLAVVDNGGVIKCQQISGGDGFDTMG